MNRTVHDVLAVWREAERLQEVLPAGSTARSQIAWEAMRLRGAYRLITDPKRSTSELTRRSAGIVRVVDEARTSMRKVERATGALSLTSAGKG